MTVGSVPNLPSSSAMPSAVRRLDSVLGRLAAGLRRPVAVPVPLPGEPGLLAAAAPIRGAACIGKISGSDTTV